MIPGYNDRVIGVFTNHIALSLLVLVLFFLSRAILQILIYRGGGANPSHSRENESEDIVSNIRYQFCPVTGLPITSAIETNKTHTVTHTHNRQSLDKLGRGCLGG